VRTLRELIERHSEQNSEFRYYIKHIDEAEANEVAHPDITIECCTALFQGISKTIVNRLNPPADAKAFADGSVQSQVRAALKCLAAGDDVIEIDFPRRAESLIQIIGELRNQRGDISHGRAVPKELQSDRSLARLVLNLTEAIVRYMLGSFFALQPERPFVPPYDDNEAFNAYLDADAALPGKISYSRALHAQYPEDYVIHLKEYTDEQEALSAERDAGFSAEGNASGDAY
jgi:hypothetical protein